MDYTDWKMMYWITVYKWLYWITNAIRTNLICSDVQDFAEDVQNKSDRCTGLSLR